MAASLLAAGLALACSRGSAAIRIDPKFSVNVARVPSGFPGSGAQLSPAQRDALARRGRPDFVRYWWKADGAPVNAAGLGAAMQEAGTSPNVKETWIYLSEDRKLEIRFDQGRAEESPLDEKIELVCRHGDPRTVAVVPALGAAPERETWIWIDPPLRAEFEGSRRVAPAGPK